MLIVSWIFIGCGVWVVLMGAMTFYCLAEDLNEREYIKLSNNPQLRKDNML